MGWRAPGRRGSLWSATGAFLLLGGVAMPVIAQDISARMGRLAEQGVVDEARVIAREEFDRMRHDYRGRLRPGRDDHVLTLRINARAATPHGEYVGTGVLRPSRGASWTTHDLSVPAGVWERQDIGSQVAVTFIPGQVLLDKDAIQLTRTVVEQGSWWFALSLWAGALLLLAGGAFCLRRGHLAARR